ncbi:MAG: hypothetical protein QW469_00325 [Candidatus Aenigmatarchaeota archaeon]
MPNLSLSNEIEKIFFNYYINKKEIIKIFDRYFDLIKLPRRKVEFYESVYEATRNASCHISYQVADDAPWSVARYMTYITMNADPDADWSMVYNMAWDAVRDSAYEAAYYTIWNIIRNINQNATYDATDYAVWNATLHHDIVYDISSFHLLKNGVFIFWVLKDKVIVLTRPIIRQVNGVLHSTTDPALEWQKEKHYFLWGVKLQKKLWKKIVNQELSFKEIMSINNIEQRMVALKMMDAEKLLKESGAKLIDKSEKGNKLYLVENIFRQPAYFLEYKCPSTGKVYISGIDPDIAKQNPKADFCMAWKLGIKIDDYLNNLIQET